MCPRLPCTTRTVASSSRVPQLALVQLLFATAIALPTTSSSLAETRCPPGAITVEPGASIQAAVDRAGDGGTFCLKSGIHRMQAVRPRPRQSFHGEGQTILNGSVLLTDFSREGRYWVASWRALRVRQRGECAKTTSSLRLS